MNSLVSDILGVVVAAGQTEQISMQGPTGQAPQSWGDLGRYDAETRGATDHLEG